MKNNIHINWTASKTIAKHIIFWIAVFFAYTFILSYFNTLSRVARFNLINVPLFMLAYYLLRYFQLPHLYNKRKYLLFALSFIVSSTILFFAHIAIWHLTMEDDFSPFLNSQSLSFDRYLVKTIRFYSPAMALLAFEMHYLRKEEQKKVKRLEKEKMATELKFLKAQLNPHFLFNTLNNLYSYVVTESPKAPDMILKLSGILDYILYRSQQKSVPIQEEINTIKHFMGLEQIRYGERLKLSFQTEGDMTRLISPLILLSLVENAFKYGASGDIEQPKIDIHISASTDAIVTQIWNTKSKHQGELNDAYKKDVGLSNIKRQLELLYPNQYKLKTENQADSFSLSLQIKPNHE